MATTLTFHATIVGEQDGISISPSIGGHDYGGRTKGAILLWIPTMVVLRCIYVGAVTVIYLRDPMMLLIIGPP